VKAAGNAAAAKTLGQFETALADAASIRPISVTSARIHLERLVARSRELVDELTSEGVSPSSGEAQEWARMLHKQCEKALQELVSLAPQRLPTDGEPAEPDGYVLGGSSGGSSPATAVPTLRELANQGSKWAQEQLELLEHLAFQTTEMARMEYGFLFNSARRQLAIGYNAGEHRLDASYYDLLASEARLCNFIAIAQEQLPQESWFALGRILTAHEGEPALLSWSGSMFEYLMPLLVMPTYDNTLLDQTYKAAVDRQIAYGKERNVPWGVSESGYNAVDVHFNYQ
jgi:hypothetical protein